MPISFEHMTSQVRFVLNDQRDTESQEYYPLKNAQLAITGVSNDLFLDVKNGNIIQGMTDDRVVLNETNHPFCIAPSNPGDSTKLNLNLNLLSDYGSGNSKQTFNRTFYYTFLPNHSYLLTINIRTSSISVKSTINEWVSVSSDELIIKE
jgi:hypothetical protein